MFNKNNYMIDSTFVDINKIRSTIEDENSWFIYEIPLIYEFRPDLIAYDIYRDVSMADYLSIVNNIIETPDGYYRYRKIKAIKPEYKESLNI